MFAHFPFHFPVDLQQTILILNTVLLIAALVVTEIVYAEAPVQKRRELRLFLPLFVVIAGLLVYAVYLQRKGL